MKTSRIKFVIIFFVAAFAFVGISNLLLGPVINGDWFPGADSPIAWKQTLAAILYPVKIVLVGPLSLVFNDPEPAPPIRMLACALYWTPIALGLHYLLRSCLKTIENFFCVETHNCVSRRTSLFAGYLAP